MVVVVVGGGGWWLLVVVGGGGSGGGWWWWWLVVVEAPSCLGPGLRVEQLCHEPHRQCRPRRGRRQERGRLEHGQEVVGVVGGADRAAPEQGVESQPDDPEDGHPPPREDRPVEARPEQAAPQVGGAVPKPGLALARGDRRRPRHAGRARVGVAARPQALVEHAPAAGQDPAQLPRRAHQPDEEAGAPRGGRVVARCAVRSGEEHRSSDG